MPLDKIESDAEHGFLLAEAERIGRGMGRRETFVELHELRGRLRTTRNALALAIELLEKGQFEAYQITLLKLAMGEWK